MSDTDTVEPKDDAAQSTGDDSTEKTTNTEQRDGEGNPPGADQLGDAGKKALDAMKTQRKEALEQARQIKAEFDAYRAQQEGKEAEHAQALEAQRVKDEALSAANQRILKAEIRAAAAGKLNDPTDALAYLDLSSFEVDDDGNVDSEAIGSALGDLITRKPYLAAQGGRFQGDADGGARKESRPSQLTRSDLSSMSPDQIEAARKEGRLDDLMSGKN